MTYPATEYINTISLGDQALNAWSIAANYRSITSNIFDVFETNIFYPLENTLTFSDPNITPVILFFFLFKFSTNIILIHNVIALANYILSAFFAYLLSYELYKCRKSAYWGGFVFAFCHFSLSHIHWIQLGAQWIPFTLLFLIRYRKTLLLHNLCLFYFGILFQLYSGLYYFIYLVLTVAIFFLFFSGDFLQITKSKKGYFISLFTGGIFALALASPLIYTYTFTHGKYGFARTAIDLLIGSAHWQDYLMPNQYSLFYGLHQKFFQAPLLYWEKFLFPGFLAVLLLVCLATALTNSLRLRRKEKIFSLNYILFFVLVGLFFLFLSFGPSKNGSFSWFSLFSGWIPGLSGIRVPARAGIMVMLSVAILSSFGLAEVFKYLNHRKWESISIFLFCMLFGGYEYWTYEKGFGKYPYNASEKIPEVYNWIAHNVHDNEALIELPIGNIQQETLRMYYSTFHWKKIVNGYSGYRSPFVGALNYYGLENLSEKSVSLLRNKKVRYVIIEKRNFNLLKDKIESNGIALSWENEDHLVFNLY